MLDGAPTTTVSAPWESPDYDQPDQVGGYQLAGPWLRIAAASLEFVCIPVAIVIGLFVVGVLTSWISGEDGFIVSLIPGTILIAAGLNAVGFFVVSRAGHSPVKYLLGMKVVGADGTLLPWERRFLRDIVFKWGVLALLQVWHIITNDYLLEGFLLLAAAAWSVLLLGEFLTIFLNSKHQAFHDRLFDTVVVHEPKPTV